MAFLPRNGAGWRHGQLAPFLFKGGPTVAAYPCQRCDQRFDGEAHNAYLSFFHRDDKLSFRWIICPACETSLKDEWAPKAMHRDPVGDWLMPGEVDDVDSWWIQATISQNGRGGPSGRR